jgi:DNA-binding FadR family transcriptional regulator
MLRNGSRKLRRGKLSEQLVAEIQDMIFCGELKTGEVLPTERELMELFEVGRSSVREALFSLTKAGLITMGPGSRPQVATPTSEALVEGLDSAVRYLLTDPNGVRELQEARIFFEVGLARHAAKNARPADLEELQAALEAHLNAGNNPHILERLDLEFHFVIAKISRQRLFLNLHEALLSWLLEQRSVTMRVLDAAQRAREGHQRIYEAIANGDADAAETAMRAHLEEVMDFYWSAVQSDDLQDRHQQSKLPVRPEPQ